MRVILAVLCALLVACSTTVKDPYGGSMTVTLGGGSETTTATTPTTPNAPSTAPGMVEGTPPTPSASTLPNVLREPVARVLKNAATGKLLAAWEASLDLCEALGAMLEAAPEPSTPLEAGVPKKSDTEKRADAAFANLPE